MGSSLAKRRAAGSYQRAPLPGQAGVGIGVTAIVAGPQRVRGGGLACDLAEGVVGHMVDHAGHAASGATDRPVGHAALPVGQSPQNAAGRVFLGEQLIDCRSVQEAGLDCPGFAHDQQRILQAGLAAQVVEGGFAGQLLKRAKT